MHYKNLFFLLYLLFYSNQSFSSDFHIINTDKAYLRAGPGKWYPVKWVLKIPGLPIRVIEKNNGYNMVKLYDGTVGWVSSNLISNKKNLLVIEDTVIVDKKNNPLVKVKKNVVLNSFGCFKDNNKKYCKVKIHNIKGQIKSDKVWGDIKQDEDLFNLMQ